MCGPMWTTSMGNARYVIIFIDNFSMKMWFSGVFEDLKECKIVIKMQSEHKIKTVWLDNYREFICKAFDYFWKDHDIEK